ncbi:hypothetical protein FE840_013570 [Peteryoungia desertarenae]|uniref:Uncharacterized protein n=1 Tax=Peteryoungia desertarenae TaxID=1813451 RepID=A0ABX6QPD2_9HYPH|nr:DUF6632 domain-containing protein [Peteryoungia desertarenae]QLF70481.1 hypothetical protein FE840_013570 [Peteryoungia desertarenae]
MTTIRNERLLKTAMIAFGIVFCFVYPLALVWPSGWMWHGGHGAYYFVMICGIYATLGVFLILASRNPGAHTSLISFTIWSSVVHALIMAVQVFHDGQNEWGHLLGDVPALLLVAAVLGYLMPAAVKPAT